jgi:hypothetical protein
MKELEQNELELQLRLYEAATRQANAAASKARAIIEEGLCDPKSEEFCPVAEKRFSEWQESISGVLANQMEKTGLGLEADPDCFGGDSGDPLDYTLDEVRWPLNALEDYYYERMEKLQLGSHDETVWQKIDRLIEFYQLIRSKK